MQLVLRAKEMMEYLPPYWHENEEMKRILHAQSVEIDRLHEDAFVILNDAFLLTMGEKRIVEWEKWLKLPPTGSLEDRRLQIMRYFGVISKLNEEAIKVLVATLHDDARAKVQIIDSDIKITVIPLPENSLDELDFTKLTEQLTIRKPCHLGLVIVRGYSNWGDVKNTIQTWGDVKNDFKNWEGVFLYIPE